MRFTAPRADPMVFGVLMGQMKSMLGNQRATPEFAFGEMLQQTLSQNHPRRKTPTEADLASVNLDKAIAFYKDRFADASDFTFIFVGTVTPDQVRPLAEKYLASLPSTGRKETWKDLGVTKPSGVVERTVEKGIEPKSQTSLNFHGPFAYTQVERVAINAMADVLETRLREALREDLGGTYSVSVSAGYTRIPRAEYSLTVSFGSDPSRAAALSARVFEEIAALKTNGPTEKQVTDVQAALTRDFETNIKQNGYILGQLAAKYQSGEAPESVLEVPSYYAKVTPAMVQDAARRYLDITKYVKVVLLPEKKN
jgi:zinc protease